MTSGPRNVIVRVRLSEEEAALVDAARGEAERGAWVRDAALTAARPPSPVPPKPGRPRGKLPCEHRIPPGSYCRSCQRMI